MSELPGLFHDYSDEKFDTSEESQSSGAKYVVGVVVIGLISAFGVIAYYGLGPMLVKPFSPPVISSAPDAAEVLGLNSDQLGSGILPIADEELKQQLLQRLAANVSLPEGEQVSVLHIQKVPQHDSDSLFAQAKENDVLFVLVQTGAAYLYRPTEDKVVASGSATVEQ